MRRLMSALPGLDRRPIAAVGVVLWIAVSPWAWGFADSAPAVANHAFLVLGFGPLVLMIAALRPAAWVSLVGGAWLAISPWVLGYATDHLAWLNELLTGLLLMALCASAAGLVGRGRAVPAPTPTAAVDPVGSAP